VDESKYKEIPPIGKTKEVTSLREVSYEEYFGKRNTTKNEGSRARLLIADTPKNKARIEEYKRDSDYWTVHPDTGHYDFSSTASNPSVEKMLGEQAKESYTQAGLKPFYERNKADIIEWDKLMLENGLHGGFIEGQLMSFVGQAKRTKNPESLRNPYVDGRVPFKGIKKFLEIRNRIYEKEKGRQEYK
jgi:hypothetical protein